jgi:lysophospholipase L1-like esterase
MRNFIRATTALLLLATTSVTFAAPKKILVIGDSLSREYGLEFPEFEDARNWVEILADERPTQISFGSFNGANYDYNNAIPTYTAQDYRDAVTGSGFDDRAIQFLIEDDLDEVHCVVIFLGGNDIDSVYGDIYGGNTTAATTIRNRIKSDLTQIIDYVRSEDSNVDMVLVNVPHVGATPEVKGDHPTDPVKTQRVTDALITLNSQLATLAQQKGIAYADIYTLTADLLSDDDYFIGARNFINAGSDEGDPEYIWLGGDLSQNFHPNTQGQSVIANAIIAAMNDDLSYNIPPLSNREIVEDIVGLDYDQIFKDWAATHSLTNPQLTADDDNDGLNNLLEFTFDLDPKSPDPSILQVNPNSTFFEFTYTPRTDLLGYVNIQPQFSLDLKTWNPIAAANITQNPNGSRTARLPKIEPRIQARIRVTVTE